MRLEPYTRVYKNIRAKIYKILNSTLDQAAVNMVYIIECVTFFAYPCKGTAEIFNKLKFSALCFAILDKRKEYEELQLTIDDGERRQLQINDGGRDRRR